MKRDRFHIGLIYLKTATLIAFITCVVGLVSRSFDPVRALEGLISLDLYGTSTIPADARAIYEFMVLLFTWLSILLFLMQYVVIQYAIANQEQWAFYTVLSVILLWLLGGAGITWYSGAYAYFYSLAGVGLLFLPPLWLIKPKS